MNSSYAGYMGKIIFVDLATRQISDYPWSDQERELYLGGKIMAARILYDNLTGKEAPFSDENLLVITTGPLTGTGAPSSSRFNISTISPLTGITTSSNCGGNFGYYLKKAGYDPLARGKRFRVTGMTGPLKAGEIERARAWGARLARELRG